MLFERIKLLADKNGMSLIELALKMGWSEKAIYNWRTSSPSIEKVQQIADYFKVSLDELMDRKEYWKAYDESLGEDKLNELKKSVKDAEERSHLIAAHTDDHVSDEQMKEILQFIEFIKTKHDM